MKLKTEKQSEKLLNTAEKIGDLQIECKQIDSFFKALDEIDFKSPYIRLLIGDRESDNYVEANLSPLRMEELSKKVIKAIKQAYLDRLEEIDAGIEKIVRKGAK